MLATGGAIFTEDNRQVLRRRVTVVYHTLATVAREIAAKLKARLMKTLNLGPAGLSLSEYRHDVMAACHALRDSCVGLIMKILMKLTTSPVFVAMRRRYRPFVAGIGAR